MMSRAIFFHLHSDGVSVKRSSRADGSRAVTHAGCSSVSEFKFGSTILTLSGKRISLLSNFWMAESIS